MTLEQFAALKPGDKIENLAASCTGEVSRLDGKGVWIVWGQRGPAERPFFYDVQGTHYFQWNLVNDGTRGQSDAAHC